MPLYEFECDEHGSFDEQRSMALAKEPAPCPECGTSSRRILSAFRTAFLATTERRARDINERACHEPRVAQRPATVSSPHPQLHASQGRPWAIGH